MIKKTICVLILQLCSIVSADGLPGDFFYHWNSIKPSVRENGMSGALYSIFLDENTLLFNPAGIGMHNSRFENISFSFSIEPIIGYNDPLLIYQNSIKVCSQPYGAKYGGISAAFTRMTQNNGDVYETVLDSNGMIVGTGKKLSDERNYNQLILNYGKSIFIFPSVNQSIGLSIKINNDQFSNFGSPISYWTSFLNLGYVLNVKDYNFAFVINNVPLKSDLSLGLEYIFAISRNRFFAESSNNKISLLAEMSFLLKAFKYNTPDRYLCLGTEIALFKKYYLRNGINAELSEYLDYYFEYSAGIGATFKHIAADAYIIPYAKKTFRQWCCGFSISIFNLFNR